MRIFNGGRFLVYLWDDYDGTNGGALLMECAARFCAAAGLPCPGEDTLRRTPNGKPYFAYSGAPCFSLSHSGSVWGCAFSTDPIGFDVERARPREWTAIAERFFHPAERDFVLARGEEAFFLLWTAKESYVKYLGTGIDETFSAFCLTDGVGISGQSIGVTFTRPPMPEGYYACVCTAAELPALLHVRPADCCVRA